MVFYRKLAEEYLKKGCPAYVEDRLETKKWTDKQALKIIADSMKMLGGKPGGGDQNDPPPTSTRAGSKNNSGFDDMDDDIPF